MKKKRIIISLSVLILVILGVFLGSYAIGQAKEARKEEQLRKKNSGADVKELFHDQADAYMDPLEPSEKDDITIRLRAERYNITKAQIQYTTDKGVTWQTADMSYEKKDDSGYYEFWVGTIPAQKEIFYYRFVCANENGTYFVDRRLAPEISEAKGYYDCWSVLPGYDSPEWAKGALWYNINPDAFYNGDILTDAATSDMNELVSWNNQHRSLLDRYGGDLQGITEKIEHIKTLGADVVWMNPFGKAQQNAGYGPLYYNQIEPTLGNVQDFQALIDAMHENGLKVGSDAVLTFTPQLSIYSDRYNWWPLEGSLENIESPYTEMYTFYQWPDNYHLTWSGMVLDLATPTAQKLLYSEKDSFLQYYTAMGLDTWRFDCGGWLYGRTEEGYMTDKEIMGQIKSYLQDINEDIFLVAEYSDMNEGGILSKTWDSHWNIDLLNNGLRPYSTGGISESELANVLERSLEQLPRAVALGIYNCVVNHDEARLNGTYQEDAGILVLMTYIGSPSVFYGEEVNLHREQETGIGMDSSCPSMEWDECDWDYERYNRYKALGELRSKYNAVKTGALRNLVIDDANNLFAFGRFDNDGIAITVASQNEEVVTVDVKARLLGAKDGATFTDWFTGKQYQVDEEGMLHLEVVPGGSVFVSGTEASQYRGQYTLVDDKQNDATIYLADTDTYELEGKGKLGKKDDIHLAATNLYGASSISAVVDGDGEAVLTIRQDATDKAAAYNVTVSENKVVVTARTKDGGKLQTICESKYTKGNAVRIQRSGDNTFTVEVAELSEDGEVKGKWKEIKGSKTVISMEYAASAGFAPINGNVTLSNITTEMQKEDINYDDFEAASYSAMLDYSDVKHVTIEDGTMTLAAEEGISWANTYGKIHDWTFKVKLESAADKEGNYAGVWCTSDDSQWVSAGRTIVDGEPVIYIGKTTDGNMQIDCYVKDEKPTHSVVLQLQKVGCYYTLAYSYDEKTFEVLEEQVFANLSSERVGAFVAGTTEATFDYVSFGDSINDGVSDNVPYASGIVDIDYSDTVTAEITEKTSIVSGAWEYGAEGYYQTETSGTAQLGFAEKAYNDFKVNVTLQIEKGEGYAAVGFGKSEYDSEEKDGFLLKYTKDNQLILMKNGTKMASTKIQAKNGAESLRVILEVKDGNIRVYAGQNATRVLSVEDTGCKKGYVCFYSVDAAVRFMNSRITSLSATWNELTSVATLITASGGANSITLTGQTSGTSDIYGATTLLGVSTTDFVTSLQINLGKQINTSASMAEAGVLLCAPEGRSKAANGLNVALMDNGNLVFRADGEKVAEYALGEGVRNVTLMIVKKDSVCQVYVKGKSEPVMSYTDAYNRGGAYQLYVVNAKADFANFGLEDIHSETVENSMLYQLWQDGKLYNPDVNTYKENFENLSGFESLTRYRTDHGTWDITDGVLACTDAPNWASGVTIFDRRFQNYDMEFKYRFDDSSNNFAAVLMKQAKIDDTNSSATYALLLYSSGELVLAHNNAKAGTAKIANFKVDQWYQLRVVCTGSGVKVYCGNDCLIDYKDSSSAGIQGFIGFTSNRTLISFDDVLIKPLD